MKTIIFVTDNIFNKRDYLRFNIRFLKKNFKVKIYSFVKIINPKLIKKYKNYKIRELLIFNNTSEFLKELKNENNVLVIDFLGSSYYAWKIRNKIKNKNIKIAKFYNGLSEKPKLNLFNRIINLFIKKKQSAGNIFDRINIKFSNYLNKKFKPDIVFVGGDFYKTQAKKNKIKKIIEAHSWDYDIYLKIKNKKVKNNNYAVFIDGNVPDHPDYIYHKAVAPVDEKNYYKDLNNFFDNFEKKFNLKIRIAASPKSKKNILKYFFPNRKIYFNQTPILIKDSKLVILHKSTSIFYILKFLKPVFFITSNELIGTWYHDEILYNAEKFGRNLLNINNNITTKKEELFKPINKKFSDRYIQYNDKSKNTGSKLIWKIFTDSIHQKDI
tara:strand:- start:997 stop:2145 length:1149 start_codon:yes stop_codon:yes gene_type:complete